MPASRRLALLSCAAVLGGAAVPPAARADRACGTAGRPFTDGAAAVTVRRGDVSCATARSLMRRYWGRSADAFTRRVRLRHRGIRWVCRPTTSDFPYRWACRGGGARMDRFRVTARE